MQTLPVEVSVPGSAGCDSSGGTLQFDLVAGGVEMELHVLAFGSCGFRASALADIELEVPSLGGTATTVWLEPEVLVADFSDLNSVEFSFVPAGSLFTSSIPGKAFHLVEFALNARANQNEEGEIGYDVLRPGPLLPGDTVTLPVRVEIALTSGTSQPNVGRYRVRYELKTRYAPEPSTSLGLGIGAAVLAGLAKGGE